MILPSERIAKTFYVIYADFLAEKWQKNMNKNMLKQLQSINREPLFLRSVITVHLSVSEKSFIDPSGLPSHADCSLSLQSSHRSCFKLHLLLCYLSGTNLARAKW